jgi:hypothetical protein
MRTRAGVKVYARLPHRAALAALGDEARVQRLYKDLGELVPVDGWLLEDTDAPAQPIRFDDPPPLFEHRPGIPRLVLMGSARTTRVDARRTRPGRGPDALGWRAFAALDSARPGLELLWLAPPRAATAPHPHATSAWCPPGSAIRSPTRASRRSILLAAGLPVPRPLTHASSPARLDFSATAASHWVGAPTILWWTGRRRLSRRPVSASTFPLRR